MQPRYCDIMIHIIYKEKKNATAKKKKKKKNATVKKEEKKEERMPNTYTEYNTMVMIIHIYLCIM